MQDFVVATSLPAFGVGLESWLDDPTRGWRVSARCGSAVDAILPASRIDRPCVIATDELDGVLLGQELLRQVPGTVLLMLAAGPSETREAELVRAGATGVLPLTADRHDVVRAVSDLLRGRTVVSAAALRLLAGEPTDSTELTSRQQDVLRLLGEGLSSTEIADRLMLAPSTVKTHISRMGERLGLTGQRALALNAATLLGPAPPVIGMPIPPVNVAPRAPVLVGTRLTHGTER
jgi:two-component system nitrate/nitrite response regulator NarL